MNRYTPKWTVKGKFLGDAWHLKMFSDRIDIKIIIKKCQKWFWKKHTQTFRLYNPSPVCRKPFSPHWRRVIYPKCLCFFQNHFWLFLIIIFISTLSEKLYTKVTWFISQLLLRPNQNHFLWSCSFGIMSKNFCHPLWKIMVNQSWVKISAVQCKFNSLANFEENLCVSTMNADYECSLSPTTALIKLLCLYYFHCGPNQVPTVAWKFSYLVVLLIY